MAKVTHVSKPHGDGSVHAVAVGDLRVLIVCEDDVWYAQGMEIDYVAQGTSLDDVKTAFENGLGATIGLHIETYGDLKELLKIAPQAAWDEYFAHLEAVDDGTYRFTSVTADYFDAPAEEQTTVMSTNPPPAEETPLPAPKRKKLPFKGINYLEAAPC